VHRLQLVPLLLLVAAPAAAKDDRPPRRVQPALQRRINAAIDRGCEYLQGIQEKDGRWPYAHRGPPGAENEHATGGLTALCLYALAASGVPADHPSIRRGLAWVEDHPAPYRARATYATYSASLLVLALTRIDTKRHKKRIAELAELVTEGQLDSDFWTYGLASRGSAPNGRRRGGRGGGRRGRGGRRRGGAVRRHVPGDNSNSQFAVLALWAAETLAGARVPKKTWERIRDAYGRTQADDGAWPYRTSGRGGSASMSAAGLVSFVYAHAALRGGQKGLDRARRTGTAKRGLRHFVSLSRDFDNYYFVYSLERVGTVLDLPLRDWYVEGATELVRTQADDGRWHGGKNRHGDRAQAYDTALALLFLSRATLGSITPGGDPRGARKRGVVTRSDDFPDPAQPGNLARAVEYYRLVKPQTRTKLLPRFGRAGPAVVGFLIRRLAHPDAAQRANAAELLERLVEQRFFFEPEWPEEDRKRMLVPIEAFWKRNHRRLAWDDVKQRFVVR